MRQIRFLVVAPVVMLSASALAQTTTGRLIGTTVDERGVGLPGVTVTISSPALIGGEQVKATDARGEFLFLLLAPGDYTVRAELPGFVPQERREVRVPLGGAAAVVATTLLGDRRAGTPRPSCAHSPSFAECALLSPHRLEDEAGTCPGHVRVLELRTGTWTEGDGWARAVVRQRG